MTGTITYILSSAGYRAMNGPLADERRRLAGAEPPAAYVSYDPRLLAGAGWYGYRIALKGGDRQMVERARYMLSERYVIRDGYEYYADGVYVFGVMLRERVPHYGIGGVAPTPEPDALNFYMPNGGTISLNKISSPTIVELEYSIDRGATWTVWAEDQDGNRSLTITAGKRMYIRNTSTSNTGFSTNTTNYYTFSSDAPTYAYGHIGSLLCKTASNASLSSYCFVRLFSGMSFLYSAPNLPFTSLAHSAYRWMFMSSGIRTCPELPFTSTANYCCYYMFAYCSNMDGSVELMPSNLSAGANTFNHAFDGTAITEMKIHATSINTDLTAQWLANVPATGDFYCPAELTIPTGASGIPSGWTRHDI